jgi:hypothetical protein
MTTQSRIFQRLGGLGIAFSVLFVAANFLFGSSPSTGASAAKVIGYFHAHRTAETAGVFVVAAAAIAFTFFLAALRHKLGATDEGRRLSPIVTAGGTVYVVGLLLMAALQVALVDAAHFHIGAAAQSLNVLSNDTWLPVVVGLSIVSLGTGVSAIRSATLPKWLAWASVALGVLAVSGPAGSIAFLIAPLWTLTVGIVILRSTTADEKARSHEPAGSYLPARN